MDEFIKPRLASLPCTPAAERSVVMTEERETQTDVMIDDEDFFGAEQEPPVLARPKRKRGKTASHRCRMCGKEYKKDEWRILHPIPIPDSQEGVRDRNRYVSHQPGTAHSSFLPRSPTAL